MENYLLKKLFILRIFFVLGLNTQGKKKQNNKNYYFFRL